jgi:hypothetical protein
VSLPEDQGTPRSLIYVLTLKTSCSNYV